LKRQDLQEKLIRILHEIPLSLDRNSSDVLDIAKWLGRFNLPGMASSGALPVRTTFLHFLYPSIVPIFEVLFEQSVDELSEVNEIIELRVGRFPLPRGKKSASTDCPNTTIFDQMVLKAVDGWTENANHSTNVLKEYLPFAWELTDRYTQYFGRFVNENPIRVIDMALWVGRGKELISSSSAKNQLVKEAHINKTSKYNSGPKIAKEASVLAQCNDMPRMGDVFQGKIYGLSNVDNKGWRRRDIRFYKHELIRRESFGYPTPGDKITLIDTGGQRYDLNFSNPNSEKMVCLGTPSRLKPWYKKMKFDASNVGPSDKVYFKYTGVGVEFHILTEQEYIGK
jgi:hypothetical protein